MSSDPLSYLSIRELYLTFKNSKPISNSLQLVAGSTTITLTKRRKDGSTHCWLLDPVMDVPLEENLTVKPRYSRPLHPFRSLNALVVTGKELLDGCNDNSGRIIKQGDDYMLEIVATAHGIPNVEEVDIPSLPDLPLSLEDIQKGLGDLKSVLSYIGENTDVLDGIKTALDHLGNIHPIAKAAVTALTIPYKVLVNERQFNDDLKSFGEAMRTLIMCLTALQDVAKISAVEENFKKILEAVLQGSRFIQEHLKKGRLHQIADAQFRSCLTDMKSKFSGLMNNFHIAIASQLARDLDANKNAGHLEHTLKPVPEAKLGEGCMDGTRVDQLATIREWIKDTEKPNIFLIYGSPGAGKSAISSTLASEIPHSTQFFFRRDEVDRRDPTRVWPTVAFGLASEDHNMEIGILNVLKTKMPRPYNANITKQFEVLIRDPLMNTNERRPMAPFILILDALDECSQDGEQWSTFLQTLRRWSELPRSFKLVVTSRDDSTIHRTLDGVSERLQLLSGADVDITTSEDIERFIVSRFEKISSEFPSSLSSSWPGSAKIRQLVDYAAGLFILAKTMLEWIGDGDPEDRLSRIGDKLGKAEANLDALYRQILITATDRLSESELNAFTMALSAILLAKDPLSRNDLKTLFQLTDPLTELIMRKLIVVVSTQSSHLQVRHKSFSDFLLDHKRSERFAIDYETRSVEFANACLRHMNARLKFNTFDVKTSHRFNHDIPDYDEVCRSIPTSLIHSSYYWAEYLEGLVAKSSHGPTQLVALECFLHDHMLHWLEVLSLKKAIGLAPRLLTLASTYTRDCDRALSEFAADGSKFVVTFQEPISRSLPHIYVSALPFAPMQSSVSLRMRPLFANSLSIVKGRMENWPAILLHWEGHEDVVQSVAFSPDGTRVVSGSRDETIRVWDSEKGKSVMEPLRGHKSWVYSVALSHDGKRIVSGSGDKTIRIWDAVTGKSMIEPLRGHQGSVLSVAFSSDGTRIVSGSQDKTICVWDAYTGKAVMEPLRGHEDDVRSVAFSPDGRRIVSGSTDKTIRVWDADTGKSSMEPLRGHKDSIYAIAFSLDGTRIVSGSQDMTIRVWDAHTGMSIIEPLRGHEGTVFSVVFSVDGTCIVSGSEDKTIRVWDADSGESAMEPLRGHEGWVYSLAFSTDGTRIVSGSDDKTLCMWNAATSKRLIEPLQGHDDFVQSVGFCVDGTRIVSGSKDKTIHMWDGDTGKSLMEPLRGHEGCVWSVAFSADGTRIVSGSEDKTICVWNVHSGNMVMDPIQGHEDVVRSVAFSADGRRIVSGSDDKTICTWDAYTGKTMMEPLQGHGGRVWSVAFSSDGRRIVSGSQDKTIRVWDAETGKSVMEPLLGHQGEVLSVAFSADGTRIASGSQDKTIHLWDGNTGKSVMEPLRGHEDSVRSVTFSTDGTRILSGSRDKTIRVWDAHTGKSLMEPLRGHESWVTSVAFSTDGSRIVSGSPDRTIRVWDVHVGNNMLEPLGRHKGCIFSVGFSLDGTRIVSRSDDETSCIDSEMESCSFTFRDGRGLPAFCSHSKLEDGWLYDAHGNILFWLPPASRKGLYYPHTKAVIGAEATQIDLSQFMHGEHWSEICSSIRKSAEPT